MNIKLDVLLVQIIHVALLIWMFKKMMWDSLTAAIVTRKEQISKLKNADAEYANLLAKAKIDSDSTIADALARKKEIIEEAKEIAEGKVHEIIAQANHEAEQIKKESEHVYLELHEELTNKFEDMVKQTAAAGIKKLIGSKAELYQDYMSEIITK